MLKAAHGIPRRKGGLDDPTDDAGPGQCPRRDADAEPAGTETGRRFPADNGGFGPVSGKYRIPVNVGRFPEPPLDAAARTGTERIAGKHTLSKAADAPCAVYGETVRFAQGERGALSARTSELSEARQNPVADTPSAMARKAHDGLLRVMGAVGYGTAA